MYNLTLLENSSSNCFDSVVYSLLEYYRFDYEVYNIKYFYTDYYNKSSESILYSICRGKSDIRNILKDIYDIDLVFEERNESTNLFKIICNSLNNKPIGISIDPYYCHWSPFYGKSHYSHIILIVDIDLNNKKYICFDVHFNSCGYIEVDFDVINKNYERYFTFYFKEVNKPKLESLIAKIGFLLESFDINADIKKTEMIDYFIMNDRKILFPKNLETSIPLINLMWIVEDKRNFPIVLKYIENKIKKSVFSQIYELFSISEKNFVILKSMLLKYAMNGILRDYKLKSIINQIFDTDILITEQMKNALKEIDYK